MTAYEYNITVRGVNYRNQEANQSEPLKINPQGIAWYMHLTYTREVWVTPKI